MNKQRFMSALLLCGFMAAPALAFEVKPGEWESTISNIPGKLKICISPDQAKNYYQPSTLAARITAGCKATVSQSAGAVSFQAQCDKDIKREGTVKNAGANEVEWEQSTTMVFPGQTKPDTVKGKGTAKKISDTEILSEMNLDGDKQTTRIKYIGPACSKDATSLSGI